MEGIVVIPPGVLKIIPLFSGETRLLSLFIRKTEYVINLYRGNEIQNEYLFNAITSRLNGEAANLIGERDSIHTWTDLKQVLQDHFGDPRTEDCLVLELESLRINKGESYLDFCHRIQQLRSMLIAKINESVEDVGAKLSKQNIYTNISMNVFLFNLPKYLVRLVRLKNVSTLEDALKAVLEEQYFQEVYDQKQSRNPIFNQNFQGRNNYHNNFNSQASPSANTSAPNMQRAYNNNFTRNHYSPHNVVQMQTRNNVRNNNFSNNSFPSRNNNRYQNNPFYQNRQSYNNYNSLEQPRTQFQGQQFADNAQRGSQQVQPTPASGSGCDTDVTMRTASSRRVNYTDYNDNENNVLQSTFNENEQLGNFCIRASIHQSE